MERNCMQKEQPVVERVVHCDNCGSKTAHPSTDGNLYTN